MAEKSSITNARKSDELGHLEIAFKQYMDCIDNKTASQADYINAAFLAFIFQDTGVAIGENISSQAIEFAYESMFKILDGCDQKYGESSETKFWRSYFKLILFGETELDSYCQSFLKSIKLPEVLISEKERYLTQILVD